MLGRLILGLLWLTCVYSDEMKTMPMADAPMASQSSMPIDDSASEAAAMPKIKRYLSHQHSSPCPPFYPHFHMHPEPMYASRPYGPPSYPKNNVHVEQHHHQPTQFIHQPTYTSYVPKQMVHYVKQHAPVYHHPTVVAAPPIHPPIQHPHPIQPAIFKPPPRWFPYSQPMYEHKMSYHKQPSLTYAPAYEKHMPVIWPISQLKKIDYPTSHVPYAKSSIIYKPEVTKCAPCVQHQPPPPQHHQHVLQPSLSYVKVPQPTIHQIALPQPSNHYLPAHQPIVKPCDK